MEANPGSVLFMANNTPLTNFSGNTLTGGTYIVNGATGQGGYLQLDLGANGGGEILDNAAGIVLNGPTGYTFFEDPFGHNALTNLAANITAQSSFTVTGGYDFQTVGDFSNAGTVHVGGAGSALIIGPGGISSYT